MNKKIIGIFVVTLLIATAVLPVVEAIKKIDENNNFHSEVKTTTGPIPPEDCGEDVDSSLLSNDRVMIDGVPAYIWHHGCSPTASGMLIGYLDAHGYENLVDGEADFQNDQVNEMIASTENYYDYCLPMDGRGNVKPDKSEPPEGDEHDDNCLADFMYTSQSYHNLAYGGTWDSDIHEGISKYIKWKYPDPEIVLITDYFISNQHGIESFWEGYCLEIDNNRPVILSVDCNGDGRVDHSIIGIGYDYHNENVKYYGCYNTWDTDIHWYGWSASGWDSTNRWGIYSVRTYEFKNRPNKPERPMGIEEGKPYELYNFSTTTIDEDGDDIKYGWNWTGYRGNEELTVDEWTKYYDSGEKCTTSHVWSEDGFYEVRVKAMDRNKAESDWSEPLAVSMPKDKQTSNPLFLQFLENHPHLFPLLRQLFGL